jgi:hypothetical protein
MNFDSAANRGSVRRGERGPSCRSGPRRDCGLKANLAPKISLLACQMAFEKQGGVSPAAAVRQCQRHKRAREHDPEVVRLAADIHAEPRAWTPPICKVRLNSFH